MLKAKKSSACAFVFLCQLFIVISSKATLTSSVSDTISSVKNNLVQTWQSSDYGNLYLPTITWHARFAYDKEKIDKYNERPWGAGFGQSYWDKNGDWDGLYIMVFKDSFNKWEPIGGYGWEKTWRNTLDNKLNVGLGYTLGVTSRNNWNYIPIPVILPLASVGYGLTTFQMTYIPGTYNNGNVYFAWMRFQF
ncbi:TPA: lipid IV(A) palmitoyltransferase PagP [Klebsiella aerogenes]|nr:lipid IV(A) palmitoyltransferase PagP [Klebsiella aerogenes]